MFRVFKPFTIAVAVLFLAAPIRAGDMTGAISGDLLSAAVSLRGTFGLSADVDYVRSLIASPNDAGTKAWGFPMTVEEMQALDLEGRVAFQVHSEAVLDYASSLPEFGGAFFDQGEGGQLVLQFTDITDAIRTRIAQLVPTDGPTTRLETVKFSFQTLRDAMLAAPAVMPAVAPSLQLQSVAIREPENALVVEVLGPSEPPSDLASLFAAKLGVPVAIEEAPGPVVSGSCPSRSQLCSPEQGGVKVASSAGEQCTLGFIVTNGSDRRFVTAGHCSGGSWYQPNSSGLLLGTVTATLYPNLLIDMELVGFPDGQASKYIFGEGTRVIYRATAPYTGELVYGSLGNSNVVRQGTVWAGWGEYYMNGYLLHGSNVHDLATIGGDSGSPLYLRDTANGRLIGLATYSGGNSVDRWWTRLTDALAEWPGWDIYH